MNGLRSWYNGLAERERKLMAALGAVFIFMLVLLIPYSATAVLSSKRGYNEELRKAISLVQKGRNHFDIVKAQKEAVRRRYEHPAPPLAGFIEDAARKSGLEIPETQDRPEAPQGKKFKERSTVVKLRKVQLVPLVEMLERLEQTNHPISISRLNIRKRGGQADYDVELGVSAFDQVEAKVAKPTEGEGKAEKSTDEVKP